MTHTSQIVGTQAVMNVIVGRYKTFPKKSKGLLRGEYGALPGEVTPEVRALAGIDPEEVVTCRPADNIAPELEKYKEEFKDIAKSEEDCCRWHCSRRSRRSFWRGGTGNMTPVKTPVHLPLRRQEPLRTPTRSGSCMWSISSEHQ